MMNSIQHELIHDLMGLPSPGDTATSEDVSGALQEAKDYADSLVIGLLDDRGNYDASSNTFPASGGSGTAGAIKKGDIWTISVAGTLGGSAVEIGDVVRALSDAPGQTAANWVITERNLGFVPFNKAGDTLAGTAGAGYFGAIPQSSSPSAPASGFRLFADALGRLSWIGVNGFRRTFSGASLTADRMYGLPNRAGNMSLDVEATATISSSSGVVTIDLSADIKHYELTLTENVTSWVFNNVPASGTFKEILITIIQHASSAKTAVSPATAGRTAGGIAWVASTTLSSREALVLHCYNDATRTLFPTGVQV